MRRDSKPRLIACLATALLAAACVANPPPPAKTDRTAKASVRAEPDTKVERPARPLPAAEKLDKDLVMAPFARDARGCVMYRMQSKNRPGLNAVFYRTRAGDFSTIEEEAACT